MNRFIGIGRLGKDPEIRYTPDGSAVCNFSIAMDERYKDKNGEKVQKTEWVNVVAFGKLGEICGEYLKKGSLALVEGKIRTTSYEDKDGVKRYQTKITADNVEFFSTKEKPSEDKQPEDVPF